MTNLDNKSFMKTHIYFFFLLISFTIGCSQQKDIMVIPGSEINSISKKNTLKLILNEDQDLTNTDNLLIIEIPKKIVYLTLEL